MKQQENLIDEGYGRSDDQMGGKSGRNGGKSGRTYTNNLAPKFVPKKSVKKQEIEDEKRRKTIFYTLFDMLA